VEDGDTTPSLHSSDCPFLYPLTHQYHHDTLDALFVPPPTCAALSRFLPCSRWRCAAEASSKATSASACTRSGGGAGAPSCIHHQINKPPFVCTTQSFRRPCMWNQVDWHHMWRYAADASSKATSASACTRSGGGGGEPSCIHHQVYLEPCRSGSMCLYNLLGLSLGSERGEDSSSHL
jgi:hypothetical protein